MKKLLLLIPIVSISLLALSCNKTNTNDQVNINENGESKKYLFQLAGVNFEYPNNFVDSQNSSSILFLNKEYIGSIGGTPRVEVEFVSAPTSEVITNYKSSLLNDQGKVLSENSKTYNQGLIGTELIYEVIADIGKSPEDLGNVIVISHFINIPKGTLIVTSYVEDNVANMMINTMSLNQ